MGVSGNIEQELRLPKFQLTGRSSGVHRYGFSSFLASRMGLLRVPRCYADWSHGWFWGEDPGPVLLNFGSLPKDVRVVVCNDTEAMAMRNSGYEDVIVGGLPYGYIAQQSAQRRSDWLLAFPPHSAERQKLRSQQKLFLDYLSTVARDFERVVLSIYYLDLDSPLHKEARKRGFDVVVGARPDDAHSLARIRHLMDSFEFVTTNAMGSHFVYALHAGCKVSICGELYEYDDGVFDAMSSQWGEGILERLLELYSKKALRTRFQRYFVEHPRSGTADVAYAARQLGLPSQMDDAQIRRVLGWTWSGQLVGLAKGFARRAKRTSDAIA